MLAKVGISIILAITVIFSPFSVSFADGDSLDPIVIRYDFDDKPSMLLAYIAQAMLNKQGHSADVYTINAPEQLTVDFFSGDAIQAMSSPVFDVWSGKHKTHSAGFSEHVGWRIPKYMSHLCNAQDQVLPTECLIDLSRIPPSTRIYADLAGRRGRDIGDPCISAENRHLRVIYATRAAISAQATKALEQQQLILIETRSFGKFATQEDGLWVHFEKRNSPTCSYEREYFFVFPTGIKAKTLDIVGRINVTHDEMIQMLSKLESMKPLKVAKEYVEKRD